MSAYMIFTRDKTLDEQELATYQKEVPATLAGHDVKVLVLHGPHEDLEGSATEETIVLEFPSVAAAKAWYDGPLYRKIRERRFHAAIYRVTLVEGV